MGEGCAKICVQIGTQQTGSFSREVCHMTSRNMFFVACNNHSISANPATLSPQQCIMQIHCVSQETRVRGFTAEQRFERFPLAREPTTDDLSA